MGWLTGWSYRKKIKVHGSMVSEALSDFPVTLHINATSGRLDKDLTAIFDEIGANNLKLAITTDDGLTQCPVEIDYWDESGETAVIHFKAPSLPTDSSTYFYLYYDSSQADNSTYVGVVTSAVAQSVWDDNFIAVYHLAQDPSGGADAVKDSTSNVNHMTSVGSMTTGDLIESHPGTGMSFDGVNDGLKVDSATNVPTNYPCTLEVSGPATATPSGNTNPIIDIVDASNDKQVMAVYLYDTKARLMAFNTTSTYAEGTDSLLTGQFVHLAGVFNSTGSRDVYTNGADKQSDATVINFATNVDRICIGCFGDSTPTYLPGEASEGRVSNVARSEAWIQVTHATLNDTLITYYEDDEKELSGEWHPDYSNRIAFTIDSSLVTAALTDFPVALHVGSSSGINTADLTDFFDKLTYTLTGDEFTGTDGDAPDSDLWRNVSAGAVLDTNRFKMSTASGTMSASSVFNLTGDFNVRVDLDMASFPTGDGYGYYMEFYISPADKFWISLSYWASSPYYRYVAKTWKSGVTSVTDKTTNQANPCKFRMRRVGSTVYMDVETLGVWYTVKTMTGFSTEDGYIKLVNNRWGVNPSTTGYFDDFVISTGTVVWPQGTYPYRKKTAITDEDGLTVLPTEIELFDQTNERATFHAKVPVIPSTRDKKLFLYYDALASDNDEMGDTGDAVAQSVWDDNYELIYHFASGGTDNTIDSTENGHDAVDDGTELGAYQQCGSFKIVDATGAHRIELSDNAALRGLSAMSMEMYFKVNDSANWVKLLDYTSDLAASDDRKYRLYINNLGSLIWGMWDSADAAIGTHTFAGYAFETWQVKGITYDSSTGILKAFEDGVDVGGSSGLSGAINNNSNGDFILGRDNYASYIGGFAYSELRISTIARSAAWMEVSGLSIKDSLLRASTETTRTENAWLTTSGGILWKYRMPITISHAKVDANLTDFPLAINLSDSAGITGFDATHFFQELSSAGTAATETIDILQGKKVAFTISDKTTEIYGELDHISMEDKSAIYHVKVPVVSSSVDTVIYLYYDEERSVNSTYIGSTGDAVAQNVWDSDFEVVMNMGQNPNSDSAGAILDSTINEVDGTTSGTMISADLVDGLVGKALEFDGIDDKLEMTLANALSTADYTIEMAYKASGSALARLLGPQHEVSGPGYEMYFPYTTHYWTDGENWIQRDTAGRYEMDMPSEADVWHQSSWKRVSGVVHGFADGVEQDPLVATGTDYSQSGYDFTELDIMCGSLYYNSTNYYSAHTMSSLRISSVARSDSWIQATVDGLFDTLVTISEQDMWLNDYQDGGRHKITIDSNKIDADLTDFPVPIMLNSTNAATLFTDLQNYDDQITGDTFDGVDLAAPDTVLWADQPGYDSNNYHYIYGNKLRIHSQGGVGSEGVQSIFKVNGDFDCTVTWGMILDPGATSGTEFEFELRIDNSNRMIVYYEPHSDKYRCKGFIGGSATSNEYGTVQTSGAFRIARTGSNWTGYRWNGSGWTAILSGHAIGSGDAYVRIYNKIYGGSPSATCDYNTLTITGTTIWPYDRHPVAKKLAITDVNGNRLNTEVGSIDMVNETIELHTLVHNLPSDEDTLLYAYYGYTAPDNDMIDFAGSAVGQSVWDEYFGAVYHMSQFPGTVAIVRLLDSTSNENNGTPAGSMNASDMVAGPNSTRAIDFDGTDDAFEFSNDASLSPEAGTFTIEGIAETMVSGYRRIWSDYGATTQHLAMLGIGADDKLRSLFRDGDGDTLNISGLGTALTDGDWLHMAVVRTTATTLTGYVDGTAIGSTGNASTGTISLNAGEGPRIGSYDTGGGNLELWEGGISEVRISTTARSAAWLKATSSGLVTGNLLSVGPDETLVTVSTANAGVNIGGSFKTITFDDSRILVASAWKNYEELWVCVGGSFKQIV